MRAWGAVVVAVARHPSLWVVAVRQALRLVPRGWWRQAPFLPVPARTYREFRTVTQYGRADHPPLPADVLNYLSWCRHVG